VSAEAVLVLERSPGEPGRKWKLSDAEASIGRGSDCDIVLDDPEVSRRHAVIRRDGDRYVLADLGSKNGTHLNGAPLMRASALRDGDEISIAPRFRFRFVDLDATVPSRAPHRGLRIDETTRLVSVHGHVLDPALAPAQYALLTLLAGEPGRVYTRDEIADRCYPDAQGGVSDLAIDGVVRRLRSRLSAVDPQTEWVEAVRGHGFRLTAARAAGPQ
jgi:pSer/pThr/pTyr-binding forkhead associated (FHA) protein